MALFARTTTLSANFPGTYEQVYLAAFAAVYALGYTPDMADPNMRMICYSTPTTAFSWGENVTIGLVPQQGQVVVEVKTGSMSAAERREGLASALAFAREHLEGGEPAHIPEPTRKRYRRG